MTNELLLKRVKELEGNVKLLLMALKLSKEMFIANGMDLPRTFEILDQAIDRAEQS